MNLFFHLKGEEKYFKSSRCEYSSKMSFKINCLTDGEDCCILFLRSNVIQNL